MVANEGRESVSSNSEKRECDNPKEKLASAMTMREKFAAMAMQGMISSIKDKIPDHAESRIAQASILFADSLIAELEKSK